MVIVFSSPDHRITKLMQNSRRRAYVTGDEATLTDALFEGAEVFLTEHTHLPTH